MRVLTLKGSNKIKVTFSSAGSSVVMRHKNVFANTRIVTKYAEHDGIKTSRFSCTWEHAQTACEITDQKGKSRPKNSRRLRRLVFEPAWKWSAVLINGIKARQNVLLTSGEISSPI